MNERLQPAVEAGLLEAATAGAWAGMARALCQDPDRAHEEAIRSATLLGATLMFAAEGMGLATAPMSGFDRERVRNLLGLPKTSFRCCSSPSAPLHSAGRGKSHGAPWTTS